MMQVYDEIRAKPTTYNSIETGKSHESLLRSYHIVQKVKWLLERGTAPDVVLELILWMEAE